MKTLSLHYGLSVVLLLTLVVSASCDLGRPAAPTAVPAPPPPATPIPPTTGQAPNTSPPTTSPVPTASPPPPTASPPPPTEEAADSIADVVAGLQGLSIDEFFEESYRQLLLRTPDDVVDMGLADEYGISNDHFTNLSDAYIRETQQLEIAILDLLRTYDRASLDSEQQLSYDIYEWYLDDRVRGHAFMYDDYPVNSMTIWGLQNWIVDFMVNTIQIQDKQDAEDYVARLAQLDTWTEQLIEGLRLREEAGVIPPRYIVHDSRQQVLGHLDTERPEDIVLYTSLRDRLEQVAGLSAAEKENLLQSARTAIEEAFIPAYQELADYLAHLETVATDDDGVWKFPDGEAYYAYALRSETSTDLTPDQVHELGLAEVARVQAEMRQVAAELGYPADITMAELNQRLWEDSEYFEGPALRAEYERLIAEADEATAAVLDLRPTTGVVVENEPYGSPVAYYRLPSLDGSRPGAFFVNMDYATPHYKMPTLTYHETIPGHHTQVALAREMDLPTFRRALVFNAYAEGWAVYAEQLAWEMGLYEDDPLGNLGRLQYELLRAARLVVDTGIHARGWTWQQGAAYFEEAMGWEHSRDHILRYVIMPGQGSGYTIGMLEILELRQRAMDALGERFDLKAFHNVILGHGSMPLEILERVVDDWIAAELAAVPEAGYEPIFEPGACRFDVPDGYDVTCGDLVVPENRGRPAGNQVRLHVAVFHSTGADPAPDPVIHLVGGPGGSLLEGARFYLDRGGDQILQKRDYIMFDQRGTYYAEPFLGCPGLTEFRKDVAEQNLPLAERYAREAAFFLTCQDTLLAQGIDLSAYNSAENAADVEDLRRALGYEQVNLYGISYGTRLALTVMRDHPEHIRSVIIDSVWPPQVGLDHDVALSAHRAISAVLSACAADPSCSEKYPDLEATLYRVVAELNAEPAEVQVSHGTVFVDGYDFLESLFLSMYSINDISWIPLLIDRAGDGDLEASYYQVFDRSTYAWGMHFSVRCREELAFESQEEALAAAADLPAEFQDLFVHSYEWTLCASWQAGAADPVEDEPVVSDIPTLVLSGYYDPITPPAYGRLAAETLSNGYFFAFPTLSHGVMRSNACARQMGLQFLDDPTSAPDASCMEELEGPDFE